MDEHGAAEHTNGGPEEMRAGPPPPEGFEVTLRDGSRTWLRPIRPDDGARLQEGLSQLSRRSRYLRFHTVIDTFTDEQLRYLTEVDGVDHCAWVALPVEPEDCDAPGMGVARYVRLADEPQVAEAAITVLDRFQGRGLGTALLHTLARSAVANGVRMFRNYVLAENTSMISIFKGLGAEIAGIEGAIAQVDLPLTPFGAEPIPAADEPAQPAGDESEAPHPVPRRVLRRAAERRLPALPFVSVPVWREDEDPQTPTMKWRRPAVPDPVEPDEHASTGASGDDPANDFGDAPGARPEGDAGDAGPDDDTGDAGPDDNAGDDRSSGEAGPPGR